MDEFLSRIGLVIFLSFMFLVLFVFWGDPDLWDLWHAKAMGACKL